MIAAFIEELGLIEEEHDEMPELKPAQQAAVCLQTVIDAAAHSWRFRAWLLSLSGYVGFRKSCTLCPVAQWLSEELEASVGVLEDSLAVRPGRWIMRPAPLWVVLYVELLDSRHGLIARDEALATLDTVEAMLASRLLPAPGGGSRGER